MRFQMCVRRGVAPEQVFRRFCSTRGAGGAGGGGPTAGSIRLVQGDALDVESWRELLPAAAAGRLCDVLITDPPYCRLVRRRKHGDERDASAGARRRKLPSDPTTLRFESLAHYSAFTTAWLTLALQHGLKPGAPLVIWTNPLGRAAIVRALLPFAYAFEAEFLWAKRPLRPSPPPPHGSPPSSPLLSTSSSSASSSSSVAAASAASAATEGVEPAAAETLLRLHESALIFRHASRPAPPPEDWAAPRCAITPTPQHDHPCHKPHAAVAPLVHYYSRPGETVLDCFAGSGAVLRACARLGRRGVGMEVLPVWAERGAALED